MSSAPRTSSISPSDMNMLQTVLNEAGYDADVLSVDRSLFNAAALLVTKLFLSGETSPYALAAQLERNFGRSDRARVPYKSMLPRHAIQGLPGIRTLRKAKQSDESDLQVWENEGGVIHGRYPRSGFSVKRLRPLS
ncbi:hypothetical protein SAMN05892877_11254 [Rhizobium subbaraonis]|uniref:Uncharacterized protein n=1 Tax=Rhizobium subbaraonis TaxID=908946 RepID=A0A285UQE9_9HYPH|nr:hypothetical protein [Rhizobium subbaraonis]SOC44062.1 hypothetical protein SAMN05892877_11254 [Rhizobium subbaraonis]